MTKTIKFLFLISLIAHWPAVIKGELVDSEGMPIVYLRGEFGWKNWEPDENYRFTREGTTYRLAIGADNPVPEGRFKIGDENWQFDFGGGAKNIYVDGTTGLTLVRKGENVHTNGIYDGVISFEYTDGDQLEVSFEINSTVPSPQDHISGTLPVMYINVYSDGSHARLNNEIIDYYLDHKDYFEEAEYWLDLNGCEWMEQLGATSIGNEEAPLPLQIKARGNWTRIGFSKKPFKIKLGKKQDLLGLTPSKNKHYALLPHADDFYGYLRNFTAFNLGRRIGLPWTPNMQPVELVVNGDYRGLYFLTESIRVDEGRIEIEELEDKEESPELISGGYVVELDNYDEENQIRIEEKSYVGNQHLDMLRVTWDTPEDYSDIQKRFITDQFTAMNALIGANSDETWSYIDLDDAARYYLVWEITGHTEAYHGSTYLFRDRGEDQKWHFTPLWDAGNAFRSGTDQFFYNNDPYGNTWIPSMRENRMFNDKVVETWLWFMQRVYPGIENDITEFAGRLKEAAQADYRRWKDEPCPDGGQGVADNRDMDSRRNEVLNFLESKTKWLRGFFGNYNSGGAHEEPSPDMTPAAPLPSYARAGIEGIEAGFEGEREYYNLQGLKVKELIPGEIYIMKEGKKSRKILWR